MGFAAAPLFALQINVTYMELPGQPPHADDPSGNRLMDVVEAAAQHYMDIIGDGPHTQSDGFLGRSERL